MNSPYVFDLRLYYSYPLKKKKMALKTPGFLLPVNVIFHAFPLRK